MAKVGMASLIDTDHFLFTCMRYIELKSVRAKGMVDTHQNIRGQVTETVHLVQMIA